MDIVFASEALRRLCHDDAIASRSLDVSVVRKFRARLDDLSAAASLGYAARLPGRFHPLVGDREGQFVFHLGAGLELVIAPAGKRPRLRADGSLNLDKVVAINVIAVRKVHD